MADLSFALDLSRNEISPAQAGRLLATIGDDGIRLVSGLAPHFAFGYSAFADDTYIRTA